MVSLPEIPLERVKEVINKVKQCYKGKLSHWIQQAIPAAKNTEFVLIDRASNRHKFDSCHKRNDQGPDFKRLNLDIEHLNLGRVPYICEGSRSVVVASKHLCGTATDLTLRCLFETLNNQTPRDNEDNEDNGSTSGDTNNKSKRLKNRPVIKGIVLALCCHHQCYWPHYVGRPFLEQLGFTPSEFHVICCMTSWSTCGVRPSRTNNDPESNPKEDEKEDNNLENITGHIKALGLSIADREDIGRQCKMLLDIGRLWYLKTNGMSAKLCYYVE
ncbi:hypothetical protein QZH41_015928, partial [Actinostola sp. cb2023]